MAIFAPSISANAQTAKVATSQTTASTTFADLATTGPSVTVTIGASGLALVLLTCDMSNSTLNAFTIAGFVVSDANTVAAADTLVMGTLPANAELNHGTSVLLTGLATGSTTFKMQYRVTTGTGTFLSRNITVVPL